MRTSEHKTPSAACPRCGYDLRGQVDAWHPAYSAWVNAAKAEARDSQVVDDEGCVGAACPLEGTCSECGLRFEWADLFAPVRQVTGLYEVDDKRRVRALLSTIWAAMWCWPLWQRLKMQHEVRLDRIATVMLALFAVGYLIVAVPWFVLENSGPIRDLFAGTWPITSWGGSPWQWRPIVPLGVLAEGDWNAELYEPLVSGVWFAVCAAQCSLMPLCFLLMPISLRKAKVRRVHLVRGWLYSIGWFMLATHLQALGLVVFSAFDLFGGWGITMVPFALLAIAVWLPAVLGYVLVGTWWAVYSRYYLKLPRPQLVGWLLATVATLLSVLVVGLCGGAAEMVMDTV